MWKSFVLELHGEWSEFADECIGLSPVASRSCRKVTFQANRVHLFMPQRLHRFHTRRSPSRS
jgi:hypothetical protein